jgi:cytochrome c oxidase subunit III
MKIGTADGAAAEPVKPETPSADKSRIFMWFLLLVVIMTFGGLFSAYLVIASNRVLEWRPFSLPYQVWVSTALLLLSSLAYQFGKSALIADRATAALRWFFVTAALGAMFIASQLLAWMALVDRGLYLSGNQYAGFFYLLTGVHAIHVLGGLAALGYILLRVRLTSSDADEQKKKKGQAQAIGWYWHTMDGLWLLVLFLLGFWK